MHRHALRLPEGQRDVCPHETTRHPQTRLHCGDTRTAERMLSCKCRCVWVPASSLDFSGSPCSSSGLTSFRVGSGEGVCTPRADAEEEPLGEGTFDEVQGERRWQE